MKTGDIVLIPFPFADFTNRKVRPATVICETDDTYKDIVLCAISSVAPAFLSKNEILLTADKINGLRKNSVLKTDRIVTAKRADIIAKIGVLSSTDLQDLRNKFKALVD